MSRSLGDLLAKSLGVIAVPVVRWHSLTEKDLFIVLASDGVWTVLDSPQAVHFVEKFRHRCTGERVALRYPVSPASASIAQLLAEEARYRWYGLCEEEDVSIDDICAVVLDFK